MDTMMETTNGETDHVSLADGCDEVKGSDPKSAADKQHIDENDNLSEQDTGKIGIQELPRSGSVKSNKERFENRPQRMEKSTPDDLIILSETGSLASSKESYQSALARDKSPAQAPEDLKQFSQTGVASSTRAAFEKGDVRNASKKLEDDSDARPEAGYASQTRAAFERGDVIRAEARNQRELDNVDEIPNAGSAAEVKKKIVRAISSDDKQEKRLSYIPEKGAAASARAKYEQTASERGWKKSSQDEEDERPQAGAAKNARERFEMGDVIRAQGSQQDTWKEELPPAGTAQASKVALAEAAAKEHQRTQVDDDIPSPGSIASTKNRFQDGSFESDAKKNIFKEEAEVSPGVTRQQASRFQNPESLMKPTERTIDKEKEELSSVAPGSTSQTKERLHQEASKVTEKSFVEDDIPGPGYIASTKSRLEEEVDGRKVLQKEEAMVSPGLTQENKYRFENVESLLKSPERTIDKEKEELSAVAQGMTQQTKHMLDQEANKSAPKMIDTEDFTGVRGAMRTAADIEAGKLVKPVTKMIDSEDLPGCGVSHSG